MEFDAFGKDRGFSNDELMQIAGQVSDINFNYLLINYKIKYNIRYFSFIYFLFILLVISKIISEIII